MPRLTRLLAAILLGAGALAAPGTAIAGPAFGGPFAAGLPQAASVSVGHADRNADNAAAPPGSDDPDRPHTDPGPWPIVVFILALFVFGLVIRGSRSRRELSGPADRRRR